MIEKLEDFRFVSQDSLKRIEYRKPYPLRDQRAVLAAVDAPYLAEAVCERRLDGTKEGSVEGDWERVRTDLIGPEEVSNGLLRYDPEGKTWNPVEVAASKPGLDGVCAGWVKDVMSVGRVLPSSEWCYGRQIGLDSGAVVVVYQFSGESVDWNDPEIKAYENTLKAYNDKVDHIRSVYDRAVSDAMKTKRISAKEAADRYGVVLKRADDAKGVALTHADDAKKHAEDEAERKFAIVLAVTDADTAEGEMKIAEADASRRTELDDAEIEYRRASRRAESECNEAKSVAWDDFQDALRGIVSEYDKAVDAAEAELNANLKAEFDDFKAFYLRVRAKRMELLDYPTDITSIDHQPVTILDTDYCKEVEGKIAAARVLNTSLTRNWLGRPKIFDTGVERQWMQTDSNGNETFYRGVEVEVEHPVRPLSGELVERAYADLERCDVVKSGLMDIVSDKCRWTVVQVDRYGNRSEASYYDKEGDPNHLLFSRYRTSIYDRDEKRYRVSDIETTTEHQDYSFFYGSKIEITDAPGGVVPIDRVTAVAIVSIEERVNTLREDERVSMSDGIKGMADRYFAGIEWKDGVLSYDELYEKLRDAVDRTGGGEAIAKMILDAYEDFLNSDRAKDRSVLTLRQVAVPVSFEFAGENAGAYLKRIDDINAEVDAGDAEVYAWRDEQLADANTAFGTAQEKAMTAYKSAMDTAYANMLSDIRSAHAAFVTAVTEAARICNATVFGADDEDAVEAAFKAYDAAYGAAYGEEAEAVKDAKSRYNDTEKPEAERAYDAAMADALAARKTEESRIEAEVRTRLDKVRNPGGENKSVEERIQQVYLDRDVDYSRNDTTEVATVVEAIRENGRGRFRGSLSSVLELLPKRPTAANVEQTVIVKVERFLFPLIWYRHKTATGMDMTKYMDEIAMT